MHRRLRLLTDRVLAATRHRHFAIEVRSSDVVYCLAHLDPSLVPTRVSRKTVWAIAFAFAGDGPEGMEGRIPAPIYGHLARWYNQNAPAPAGD